MNHLREIITVLCLILLAWTLIAPASAPDLLLVLPVIGTLWVAVIALRLPNTGEFLFQPLDPSLASISVRAPPQH